IVIGSWKLTVRAARLFWRYFVRRPAAGRRHVRHVDFYDRFEALLARYGMPRSQTQTQHEFALATSGHLVESPLTQQAGLLPRRIVEAYYRVRFGHRDLTGDEAKSIEEALGELAAALAARQAGGPGMTNGKAE